MCTADGRLFGSVAEALRMANATMDYLNGPEAADLDAAACGPVLRSLAAVRAKFTAAHAAVLARFDAADAHDADGYGTSSSWLAAKAGLTTKATRGPRCGRCACCATDPAAGRRARRRGHHQVAGAGDRRVDPASCPPSMREETDQILLQAATPRERLWMTWPTIAACAIENWRAAAARPRQPRRRVRRPLRAGSAPRSAARGMIRGNLTPECAAAVRAVLEALGKKAGPEDDRTEGKRFHDALQLACELLLRARLVPDRAGADTQVVVHIPLSQLRAACPARRTAWRTPGCAARLGEDGYLTGQDAEAAACDAQTVPVVTGAMDPDVIDQIIGLARAAAEATARPTSPVPSTPARPHGHRRQWAAAWSPAGAPPPATAEHGRRQAPTPALAPHPGTAPARPSAGPGRRARSGPPRHPRATSAAVRHRPARRRPRLRPRWHRRRPCDQASSQTPTTPRASPWTSATATPSPATSAAPSCSATAAAPGPDAADPPPTATSTTCSHQGRRRRNLRQLTACCCASTTTTCASTAAAGPLDRCTPTAPPPPTDPTGRSCTATHHPPCAPGDLRFARPRSRGYLPSAT